MIELRINGVKTSLSPIAVIREAWEIAQATMKPYSHRNSPKKFTQHQLFAVLVLKEFYRTTYRGVWGILKDSSDLREAIELRHTPHWTTIQKAGDRLLGSRRIERLISETIERAIATGKMKARPKRIAIDTSGFEARSTSRYYAKRRKATQKDGPKRAVSMRRFPKLGLAVDCESHFIVAAVAGQGPTPDFAYFEPLLLGSLKRIWPTTVLADAGFSSEANHEMARDDLGIQSLMPSTNGRPTDKEPSGYYRCMMKRFLHLSNYGQRWQVETGYSMIKRRLGEVVAAMTYHRRRKLLLLKSITLNLMLLDRHILFYRACPTPFSDPNLGHWFPRHLRCPKEIDGQNVITAICSGRPVDELLQVADLSPPLTVAIGLDS